MTNQPIMSVSGRAVSEYKKPQVSNADLAADFMHDPDGAKPSRDNLYSLITLANAQAVGGGVANNADLKAMVEHETKHIRNAMRILAVNVGHRGDQKVQAVNDDLLKEVFEGDWDNMKKGKQAEQIFLKIQTLQDHFGRGADAATKLAEVLKERADMESMDRVLRPFVQKATDTLVPTNNRYGGENERLNAWNFKA